MYDAVQTRTRITGRIEFYIPLILLGKFSCLSYDKYLMKMKYYFY